MEPDPVTKIYKLIRRFKLVNDVRTPTEGEPVPPPEYEYESVQEPIS
jgi:hypothetical protein